MYSQLWVLQNFFVRILVPVFEPPLPHLEIWFLNLLQAVMKTVRKFSSFERDSTSAPICNRFGIFVANFKNPTKFSPSVETYLYLILRSGSWIYYRPLAKQCANSHHSGQISSQLLSVIDFDVYGTTTITATSNCGWDSMINAKLFSSTCGLLTVT